jgi:hypothetical protein
MSLGSGHATVQPVNATVRHDRDGRTGLRSIRGQWDRLAGVRGSRSRITDLVSHSDQLKDPALGVCSGSTDRSIRPVECLRIT